MVSGCSMFGQRWRDLDKGLFIQDCSSRIVQGMKINVGRLISSSRGTRRQISQRIMIECDFNRKILYSSLEDKCSINGPCLASSGNLRLFMI